MWRGPPGLPSRESSRLFFLFATKPKQKAERTLGSAGLAACATSQSRDTARFATSRILFIKSGNGVEDPGLDSIIENAVEP
jgi:hypothetical protein